MFIGKQELLSLGDVEITLNKYQDNVEIEDSLSGKTLTVSKIFYDINLILNHGTGKVISIERLSDDDMKTLRHHIDMILIDGETER